MMKKGIAIAVVDDNIMRVTKCGRMLLWNSYHVDIEQKRINEKFVLGNMTAHVKFTTFLPMRKCRHNRWDL